MLKQRISRRDFFIGASSLAALSVAGRPLFAQTASVVKAPCGMLRGESVGGVRVFRGVPFAEPPVGPLRFRPPVKMATWTGERSATKFAAAAMQVGAKAFPQSEDCLYLNVWTPEGATGLPVYVWVHGGGFTGGESMAAVFDGSEFAQAGVVVVTVAYRLGVLGFLNMEPLLGPEYAGSGNNALRDLICALQWVKENVSAFGGDPARVTFGGESAGAKLVDILLGVPDAQSLFSQAVSESGGAERVLPAADSIAVARGFGDLWGDDPAGMKTVAAEELIAAQTKFIASWPQHFPLRPMIDGKLLTAMPVTMIAGGSSRGKRFLVGTNRDESAAFIGPHPEHDATAADLGNMSLAAFREVYAKYKAVYPEMSDEERRIRAVTAEEYWVPTLRLVDAHLRGGGKAWMYRLDFTPSSGRMKGRAYHAEDLPLTWDKPTVDIDNAAAEAALAKQMHQAWLAFIKGEQPAAPGLPAWPEYASGTRKTMVLDVSSRLEDRPQDAELKLWEGVKVGP